MRIDGRLWVGSLGLKKKDNELDLASLKGKNVLVPLGSLILASDARVLGAYDQVSK